MINKTATAVLAEDGVHVSYKHITVLNTWETADRSVRAEEIVGAAHSAVNRLVFSRPTKTIGSSAVKLSENIAVHVIVGTERDGNS